MALKGELKIEEEKEIFTAEFTNGTVQQLKDLAQFLQKEDFKLSSDPSKRLSDVLKIAIGWLERLRENNNDSDEE